MVTKTSPHSGPVTGNTQLQIVGTSFVNTGTILVRFENGSNALYVNGSYVSSTLINCVTPSFELVSPSSVVTVEVALNGQQFTNNNISFYYYGMFSS